MPSPGLLSIFDTVYDTRSEEKKRRDAEQSAWLIKMVFMTIFIFILIFITIATTSRIFCDFYPDTEWCIQMNENIQRMENQQKEQREYEMKMNKVYCLNDNKPPCYTYAQLENFKRMREVIERNQL